MVKMETLDPSTLPSPNPTVTYDPKSETVTLPGGVVSVAGITVVTGGAELSWGSCIMAFGVWGTLIGLSVVALGLWRQSQPSGAETSHLLGLGWVILAVSVGAVGSVAVFHLATKQRRKLRRREREEGKMVLVEESGTVIKTVTV